MGFENDNFPNKYDNKNKNNNNNNNKKSIWQIHWFESNIKKCLFMSFINELKVINNLIMNINKNQ